jgi:hypothetical protein
MTEIKNPLYGYQVKELVIPEPLPNEEIGKGNATYCQKSAYKFDDEVADPVAKLSKKVFFWLDMRWAGPDISYILQDVIALPIDIEFRQKI